MDAFDRLQVRVIDSSQELQQLKEGWNGILREIAETPPFLSWEWMYTWWQVYKTNSTRLLVLVVSDNSKIVAIVPMYVRRSSLPIPRSTVYFLGTGEHESKEVFSEYLDIISIPEYSKAVCGLVVSYFVENNKFWDCIELHRVLAKSILFDNLLEDVSKKEFTFEKIKRGFRYYISLQKSWEQYIQTLRPSMRRSIVVAQKKALKQVGSKVEVVENENQIEASMHELIRLHTKSWRSRNKEGAFASREFCEFHLIIAKLFHKNNMLEILNYSIKDEVIGVLYNFKTMDTVFYYQSGLNMSKYSSLKPGVLLHSEAIKKAINEKMRNYDFMMAGQDTYKSKYGCKKSEMYNIKVWNKSLKARLLQKLSPLPFFN